MKRKRRQLLLALIFVIFLLIIAIFISTHSAKPIPKEEDPISLGTGTEKTETEPSLTPGAIRLTFDADGGKYTEYGTDGTEQIVMDGTRFGPLPVPAKEGYVFDGWRSNEGTRVGETSFMSFEKDTKLTAAYIPAAENADPRGLPILMYHWFYDPAAGETSGNANWMNIQDFEAQMAYLTENAYYYPSWSEVYAFIMGTTTLPAKSVVVSDDDCMDSFRNMAIPIIEKYKVYATSFMITDWPDDQNRTFVAEHTSENLIFRSHSSFLHVRDSEGWGLVHSWSYGDILADTQSSVEILGAAQVYCYPFGHYNDNIQNALRELGFKMAVTIENRRAYVGDDPLALPRVRMNEGVTMDEFAAYVS
jgi:peptidoglycan/xylan/chitin deacetylase (PgdA/CDA1 family)